MCGRWQSAYRRIAHKSTKCISLCTFVNRYWMRIPMDFLILRRQRLNIIGHFDIPLCFGTDESIQMQDEPKRQTPIKCWLWHTKSGELPELGRKRRCVFGICMPFDSIKLIRPNKISSVVQSLRSDTHHYRRWYADDGGGNGRVPSRKDSDIFCRTYWMYQTANCYSLAYRIYIHIYSRIL